MASKRKLGWEAADVRCPFYKMHSRTERRINCEGCVDRAELISRFANIALMEKHLGQYCAGKYEGCPVYDCVYRAKYDD